MQRTVSEQDAERRLGALLDGVSDRGDELIIERDGKAMGVVIPVERYRQIEEARVCLRNKWEEFRQDGSDLTAEEAEQLAVAEVAAYREEQRRAAQTDQRA